MKEQLPSLREWLAIAEAADQQGLQLSFIAAMQEIAMRARAAAQAATIEWPLAQPVTSHQSPVTEAEVSGLFAAAQKEAA